SGKPPADLLAADTKVSPETVQVVGPASDVEDVRVVNTSAVDISGVSAPITLEREVDLEPAGENILFSGDRVAVLVRIDQVVVTREFKRVLIEVRKVERPFRITPDQVRLTVRGPKHQIDSLELNHAAVHIDADSDDPGEYAMKPTVELPAGIEVVATDPAK